MSQRRANSSYSLRSQCRDHGSCNCRNTPGLQDRSPRSRRRRKDDSTISSSSKSSSLDDSQSSDFEESSFGYSSNSNDCIIVSSNHKHTKLSESHSDYNSSLSSDSSPTREKQLRGILLNSGERSKSWRNGEVRNVTFGFATSTPLTKTKKRLQNYEVVQDLRVEEGESVSVDTMSIHSTSRRRQSQQMSANMAKFSRLDDSEGRRTSVNRLEERFVASNGDVGVSSELIFQQRQSSTMVTTRSRGGTPASSVHSQESSASQQLRRDANAIRRRNLNNQIVHSEGDEEDNNMFYSPTGYRNYNGYSGDDRGDMDYRNQKSKWIGWIGLNGFNPYIS